VLKEIDIVLNMNSLALIFSEHHFNLKIIILRSFSFLRVLSSCLNFTTVGLFKCSFLKAQSQCWRSVGDKFWPRVVIENKESLNNRSNNPNKSGAVTLSEIL